VPRADIFAVLEVRHRGDKAIDLGDALMVTSLQSNRWRRWPVIETIKSVLTEGPWTLWLRSHTEG
jgi:hypothetical protein